MRSITGVFAALACSGAVLAGCGGSGPAVVGPGPDSSSEYSNTASVSTGAGAGASATAARARVPDGDWPQFDYDGAANRGRSGGRGDQRRNLGRLSVRMVQAARDSVTRP